MAQTKEERRVSQRAADLEYKKKNTVMKGVRFFPDDMDLLAHAEKQGAFMTYVKRLIREDMERSL